MLLRDIQPVAGKVLISPATENSSSFSIEVKKYERKSIGIVENYCSEPEIIGSTIIYDDSNSIDFTIDGKNLSIIDKKDVVAFIKEDKNGKA